MKHKICEVRFNWWQRLLILFGNKVSVYCYGPKLAKMPDIRIAVQR